MRRRTVLIPVTALLVVGLSACGAEDDENGPAVPDVAGVSVTGAFGQEPTVEVDDFDVSGTETDVLVEGDGPEVAAGENALVNLHIVNGTTGEKAYSSFDSERAQEVTITPDALPGGLDTALVGQKRGSRILVTATVANAIGPDGAEQVGLGPEDDVVFVVDLLSVHPEDALEAPEGTEQDAPAKSPVPVLDGDDVTGIDFADAAEKPSDELQVITLVEGDGPAIPDRPTFVTFDYLGTVYGGNKPFDESFSKEPATFAVGNSSLIKGWDQGLQGVTAGSRVLMVVPPELGYGEQGSPPSIPGGATLVFVIDVLGVDA